MFVAKTSLRIAAVAALAAAAFAFTAPAGAYQADSAIDSAKSAGLVGEQADGYVGVVTGANVSADVRARVDQLNIRRRAAYTERAQSTGASVTEMAAAVACQIFAQRVAPGQHYRTEAGQWRERAAGQPVEMPSFCAN